MNIYKETWVTDDGMRLDIAFTDYEINHLGVDYRMAKRNALAKQHGFDIERASKEIVVIIRERGAE